MYTKCSSYFEQEKNKELTIPRVLLWSTFCIHTEMLPVERVVADWERKAVLAPFYSLTSLYKHAKARHRLPVKVRQILSKYEMKRMALAIFVPNLAGIHQNPSTRSQVISNRGSPRPLPCPWQLSLAPEFGKRFSRVLQTRQIHSPRHWLGWGVTSGVRFGLAHLSNGL